MLRHISRNDLYLSKIHHANKYSDLIENYSKIILSKLLNVTWRKSYDLYFDELYKGIYGEQVSEDDVKKGVVKDILGFLSHSASSAVNDKFWNNLNSKFFQEQVKNNITMVNEIKKQNIVTV